jgi:gluconate 2-dehydrogenase gamma chain
MTTRREVLQSMIVSIGGASMLAACKVVVRVNPSNADGLMFYSSDELALVARVSDLIIPQTDTPGALDVNVPGFLDALMAEWADADTQREQHSNLRQLSSQLGQDFTTVDDVTAENRLSDFDSRAFDGRPGQYSEYRALKGLITQAYFASEEGALQEQQWVAVPGRWDPSVEI